MHRKKKKIFFIAILLIIIVLLLLGACHLINNNDQEQASRNISTKTVEAKTPNLTKTSDDEYFELMGFGQLEINENNQYLNLINPSENGVYLSFDVIYNNEVLYQTDLIEPGKMEQFNVYSCLDAGEHTITYSIDVYDIVDQSPLWSSIKQEQEILIKK